MGIEKEIAQHKREGSFPRPGGKVFIRTLRPHPVLSLPLLLYLSLPLYPKSDETEPSGLPELGRGGNTQERENI